MGKLTKKSLTNLIKSASRGSGIEAQFLNDLIRHIERVGNKEVSKTYKPSSMNCIRNMYYQVMGHSTEESDSNYELIGIGESGTDRHERIQSIIVELCKNSNRYEWIDVESYIKENNLINTQVVKKEKYETKCLYKPLNISFKCDGIIKIENIYHILEFKTESFFKFQNRAEVADEHTNQASCYSLAFDIENVLFIYENRDCCSKKAYIYKVSSAKKNEIKNKILKCEEHKKKNIVPEKEINKSCQYCNYKVRCKKDV